MSRLLACAVLFAAASLAVTTQTPLAAQQKDKDKASPAEKQLKAAQNELAQAERQIAALKADVLQLKAANAALQAAAKRATSDDRLDDKTIKGLQNALDGYRGAGLVHFVVLKLKADSPSSEAQSVIDDTYKELSKIKTVRGVWAGRPSSKGSPDFLFKDYTVALAFVFDDPAGLKKYLDDPIHVKFVEKHIKLWEAPVVYDFEPKK
jgi:Stress responsive A/B Barrel Domain